MKNLKAWETYQGETTANFGEGMNRDVVAQAYQHIVQFLHRYKNNIEFVTKEELTAITNIKEPIIAKVLDNLKKIGILKPQENEDYIRYYINKENLKEQ